MKGALEYLKGMLQDILDRKGGGYSCFYTANGDKHELLINNKNNEPLLRIVRAGFTEEGVNFKSVEERLYYETISIFAICGAIELENKKDLLVTDWSVNVDLPKNP